MYTFYKLCCSFLLILLIPASGWSNDPGRETKPQQESTSGKSHYKQNRGSAYHHTFGVDFGLNNYLQDQEIPVIDDYTVKPWGSWYVALNSIHSVRLLGPLHFDLSGGVSWYNFKFEDPSVRIFKNDQDVTFEPVINPEWDPVKSKLTATYLNISAVPTLYFGNHSHGDWPFDGNGGFRLGLGAYAGYKIDSYSKFVYEINGEREKDRIRSSYFVNNWRYGARFRIGFDDFDFFVNYDISTLFVQDRGPELNAISFGLTF
ncbi:MAG: hypothetical protein ACNS62_24565 [Candidatus Cyclobacteriaceae bacterium M3_2C_046]